jgi:hypothetical protein
VTDKENSGSRKLKKKADATAEIGTVAIRLVSVFAPRSADK